MENKRKTKVGVFTVSCKTSKKVYVGTSRNIDNRISWYKHQLRHRMVRTQMAMDYNKYGKDSFMFSVAMECPEEEMSDRCNEIILRCLAKGYSLYNPVVAIQGPLGSSAAVPDRYKKIVERIVPLLSNTQFSEKLNELVAYYENAPH